VIKLNSLNPEPPQWLSFTSTTAAQSASTALTALLLPPWQAYMSALTSSVEILEQRVSQLDSSGSSLAGQLNLAFGDEAQQREAAADVQLTNMYRVRNNVTEAAWLASSFDATAGIQHRETSWGPMLRQRFSSCAWSALMRRAAVQLKSNSLLPCGASM
jgi:hypothetical protein